MKLSLYGNQPIITPRDPEMPMEAANKNYVDNSILTHAEDVSLHLTTAQNTFLDALNVTAEQINQLAGISGGIQSQLDAKLDLAGGTMTGAIVLASDPTGALQPATKQYTDAADALKVAKAGDTMTGFLTLSADPTGSMHAATKQYVDSSASTHAADASLHLSSTQNTFLDGISISSSEANYLSGVTSSVQTQLDSKLALAGGTLTGTLVLAADPTAALQPATKQYTDAADALKVAKAGDTMTGALTLPGAPTADLHASTKKYVDDKDSAQATYIDNQDALKVAKAGDTMTGALTLPADPTSALHAATKQYVDNSASTHAGDASLHLTTAQNTFIDGITVSATEVNLLSGVSSNVQTQLDSKLALAGGTMTGAIVLSADPAAAMQPATKQYTDTADALKVAKAGDTMSGFLTLSAAPTSDLHASTKKYVDDKDAAQATYIDNQDALKVAKAGDTMTGLLTLSADPTGNLHAATKQYVDTTASTHAGNASLHLTAGQNTFLDAVTVSATEVNLLSGVTSNVQTQLDAKLNLAGGTMTGAITLAADPTANLQPATKQYTDTADALKVAKAGDTMTGALTLSGDPTLSSHAANKNYVDTSLSTHATNDTLHLTSGQNTFLDAVTVSSTEVNRLSGVTSNVQTQIDAKFDKAGGLITGDVTLDTNKTIFVSKTPATGTEVVNKSYVDGLLAGQKWQDPVTDINLVDDTLAAPPGSPVVNDVYIVGASATGAWAGKEGWATFWSGSAWVWLHGRAVQAGDRFGVSLTSATVVSASLTAYNDKLITVLSPTAGAITYTADTTEAGSTTLVFDPDSSKFGVSYTKTDEGTWVPTNTSVNLVAGDALELAGNILNVKSGDGLAIVTDTLQVNLESTGGLEIAGGKIQVNLDGTTLTSSANGIKVTDSVIADIAAKVQKAGDTMTGLLTLSGAPTANLHAATKLYVDTADTAIQGQVTTLQGTVATLNTDPTTKTYVDNQDALKVAKAGDTMTGFLTLSADPTANLHAATKQYVDGLGSTHAADASLHLTSGQNTFLDAVTVSAAEVNYLAGVTSAVQTQLNAKLNLAGGTMTGAIVLAADPAAALQPATKQYTDAADALKVDKAGDTMTGLLTLSAAPTSDLHASTKKYVDDKDAAQATYIDNQDALKVAKAGDTMTGFLTLSAAPTADLHAATKLYVDGLGSTHAADASLHLTSTQNTFLDGISISSAEANYLTGVSSNVQTQLDSKLALAGGTMTGAIVLAADPAAALNPATKQYTDTADALKVAKAGDTMTGALTLPGAPTADLHASTKKYVDDKDATQATYIDNQDALKVAKAGDTMTGLLTLSADPTGIMHAATKQYVDSGISTHASNEALHISPTQNTFLDGISVSSAVVNYLDGVTSSVQTQLNSKLNLAGGTMTGAIVLAADPAADMQPATKQYTDVADALKVDKVGDTMTGFLTLHANPTSNLHAATKQYVDSSTSTHISNDSLHLTSGQNTFLDAVTVSAAEVNYLTGVTSDVQTQIDSKLNLSGGTLTGALTLSADPTIALGAATKQYTDAADALKVAKAGDTMTGFLTLSAAPTADLHASTKKYVDDKDATQATYIDNQDALKVAKAGDTMTGFLTLSADPTANLHASTKKYVDDTDATQKTYIDTADGVLQGQITTLQGTVNTLNSDPVTKSYVDTQDNTKLPKAGGTMTGYISLHADPSSAMHPTTKQYVDAIAQGLLLKPAVRLATLGNLDATYTNGTSGINATLTSNTNGVLTVDGKTVIAGDRILVRLQTNGFENGDYTVQQVGDVGTPFILKRVTTVDESNEVPSSYFYVSDGSTLKGTGWTFTVTNPITFTIGTDDIYVNQFSGSGSIIAGAGLTLSGNTIDIVTGSATRIVVNADSIDLATTGVTPGTYRSTTVDGYGRVSAGTNPTTIAGYGLTDAQALNANLTSLSSVSTAGIIVRDNTNSLVTKSIISTGVGLSITNGSGAAAGSMSIDSNATDAATASTLVSRDSSGNFAANIITSALNGNASTATALETSRNFSASGDATATAVSFNGTGNVDLALTLANSGITAGTYTKTTFDAKGRATGGSTPSLIADLGITNVYTKTEVDALVADLQSQIRDLQAYIISKT